MVSINLDLDSEKLNFILTGDIKKIISDNSIKFYLKDFLKAEFQEDAIYVPYVSETKENILKKIRELLSHFSLDESPSEKIKENMHRYFLEEKNFQEFSKKAKDIRDNHCDKEEFSQFIEVIDKTLTARRLYPLQILSAYHLAFSQNACNFSVPGSGKTSIVYGTFAYLKSLPKDNPKHVDKLLIIGPLSSFGPWEQEYRECFGKQPSSKRLYGRLTREEKIDYLYSSSSCEITLMSYQGVPNLREDIKSFLRRNDVMVILDEAHRIKNVEGGIIATSILSLSRFSKARVILTGTPLPNGFQDLSNLYSFIWPTKEIIPFHLYQLKEMSKDAFDVRINQLIDAASPFFVRIKKSDLKIPNPVEHPPLMVDMGPAQRRIYEFIERKYMDFFTNESSAQTFRDTLSRARLVRLMQAATNPALLQKPLDEYYREQGITDNILLDDSEVIRDIRDYNSTETPQKFIEVEKIVKKIIERDEKVIIWTTFVQNIFDISNHLAKKGIKSKMIYGEIPIDLDENDTVSETREKIIKEFHDKDSDFKVLIANPFSVAESISLHKACHNAIYLERTFNAGHFIQSKDRIHRYGLKPTDRISYYYILSNDSIDCTIHERLAFKERRMNQIIESQPIPLFFNLDNEDLADADIRRLIDDYVKRTTKT